MSHPIHTNNPSGGLIHWRRFFALFLLAITTVASPQASAGQTDPLATWQPANLPGSKNYNGVAFGDGLFVAAGDAGNIATSTDGANWSASASGVDANFYAVAHGNHTFVAVGGSGTILTSADGRQWKRQTSATSDALYAITFGNGLFVAGGGRNTVLTSLDGIHWTEQAVPGRSLLSVLSGITFGNGLFVAVGNAFDDKTQPFGSILISPDGQGWVAQNSGTSLALSSVVATPRIFVAVGGTSSFISGTHSALLTSSDGTNWTNRATNGAPFDHILNSVAYGAGTFVAVGNRGTILTSTDGVHWTARASGTSANLSATAFGATSFAIVGENAASFQSGTITSVPPPPALTPSLSVSPAVITNDYAGQIDVTITNLTAGTSARVELFLDLAGNGIVDPEDHLVQSVLVTDGASPTLAGRLDSNIPRDLDATTNGVIHLSLSLPEDKGLGKLAGSYLYRIIDPTGKFAPVTAPFKILPKTDTQGLNGVVTDGETGQPLAGALAILLNPDGPKITATAFSDGQGKFTVYAPPGAYILVALKTGYVAVIDQTDLISLFKLVVSIPQGKIVSGNFPLTPAPETISGKVTGSSSGTGLPGILLYGLGRSKSSIGLAFAFTDEQGAFKMPVTSNLWNIALPTQALAQQGYVALDPVPPLDATTNSLSGVSIKVPEASALIYGRVQTESGTPVPHLALVATDADGYKTAAVTDQGGNYSLGVIPGTWNVELDVPGLDALGFQAADAADITVAGTQSVQHDFFVLPIPAPSPALGEWHWRNPLPQGNGLRGVAYGNGRYVAVGDTGTILVSSNKVDWKLVFRETAQNLKAVVFANGAFWAVGDAGTVMTSPDGISWNNFNVGSDAMLESIAYGKGKYVAVGRTEVFASSDGVNWKAVASLPNTIGSSVAFNGSLFVAVGSNAAILISSDGLEWKNSTFDTKNILLGVSAVNGTFFLSGLSGTLASSTDGTKWTPIDSGSRGNLYAVAYGNGVYVALGSDSTDEMASILSSTDGIHWREENAGALAGLRAITFAQDSFVAVGNAGTIAISKDGKSWIPRSSGSTLPFSQIAYGNGFFLALDSSGVAHRSEDGVVWTDSPGPFFGGAGLAYGNGIFVAVSGSGSHAVSHDGIHWTENFIPGLFLKTITFGGGNFVAAGQGEDLAISQDGLHWQITKPPGNDFRSIVYGNGDYVLTDGFGSFRSSRDFKTWQSGQLSTSTFIGMVFGNGHFLVLYRTAGFSAITYQAFTSTDGVTWTSQSANFTDMINSIGYAFGNFVAVGYNGKLLTSGDGVHWFAQDSGTDNSLNSIAYGNGTFIVGGWNGALLQSNPLPDPTPIITQQPLSHTVRPGATVALDVQTKGAVALTYQWLKNGQPIAGATTSTLLLSNVQSLSAGNYSVIVSNGPVFTVSSSATITFQGQVSDPLENWQVNRSATNNLFSILAYDYTTPELIVVGDNGALLQSFDGTFWFQENSGTKAPLFAVASPLSELLAVGQGGTLVAAPDINSKWTLRNANVTNDLFDIAFLKNLDIVVGDNGTILTSVGGINWTNQVSGTDQSLNGIASANGLLLAVGDRGIIRSSQDGVSWTSQASRTTNVLLRVAYAGGQFIAVGDKGTIVSSSDGKQWALRASGTTNVLWSVAWANGTIVAVGNNGTILTSTDGIHWKSRPSGTTVALYSVTFFKGRWVAVGGQGTILISDPVVSLEMAMQQVPTLTIRGLPEQLYRLEYTDDLRADKDWKWLDTVYLSRSSATYSDTQWSRSKTRYYRAVLLPGIL